MSQTNRLICLVAMLCALEWRTAAAQEATVVSGTVTTRADGLSLPGAEVSIPTLGLSAVTDASGRYEMTVPADSANGQTVDIRVTFAGLQPASERIRLTPGGATQDFALVVGFTEEITVGSRAPGIAAQQAVPVDIITSTQIQATGLSETNQIIQALAPSFNFPRPTITDGTDTVRPATLRGLGPDQVLVLVNGKRRHTSALVHVNSSIGRGSTGVDLNAIPASAIEKIEILRDGAAAQYGSDAIAGVINIVLKGGGSAGNVSVKAGQTTKGDGEQVDTAAGYTFTLGNGFVHVTGEYRDRNRTNRAGPDPRPQGSRDPVPQPNHRWGDGDTNDVMVFANSSMPLNRAQDKFLYAFGGFSRRLGNSAGFFRRALDNRNQPSIYPNGFLPLIEPDVVDWSATGGTRGTLRGWFYDASAQFGHNSFDFHVTNSLNTSLGPTIPPNQTEFYSGSLIFNQFVANADMSRPFSVGPFEKLNVAFGLETRWENYKLLPGEEASYIDGGFPDPFGARATPGAQVFPGFKPSNAADEGRSSFAAYVDVEGNPDTKVRVGAAGRYEYFTDFGDTADGKLSLRVEPVRQLVLRGAVSSGFRAPSLSQSFFSAVSTNFLNVGGTLVPFEVGTFPVNSPVARALGAQDLKPEQSVHYSAGIVISPVPEAEISADLYRIDIDDRIVFSGNFTGGRITALLQPFGATGARFFTNAIDTRTKGADLQAVYRFDLGEHGQLRLSTGYNNTQTTILGDAQTPPQLAGLGNVLFDRIERRRIECGQPRDSVLVGGQWTGGPVGVNLTSRRYGTFCSFTADPAIDQTFSAKWVTDFEVGVSLQEQVRLAVGAQNLFDAYPDRNTFPNSFNGIQTYPSQSPFGMNGRFLYARLAYALR